MSTAVSGSAASVASVALSKFVEQYDLPCTVMVTTGYSCGTGDEDDSLSQGEVITLHSVQQDQVVHANDHLGREQILPAIGTRKYQYLPADPEHDSVMYDTVQELINDVDRPETVRVTASVDSGEDESTVYVDDILHVVKIEAKPGPRGGSVNPMLIATNGFGETLRLPTDTPAKFSAQLDVKWYSMAEILTKGDFPVRVNLVHSHPGYQQQGMDKFTITGTSLSRNVLVTVNRELLAMPVDTQIEVTLKEDAQPADVPLFGREVSGGNELYDDDILPPPPDAELLIIEETPVPAAAAATALSDDAAKPPKPKPPPVKVRPKPSVRKHDESRKSLLTEIEAVRLRMGSVRTFGTSRRISSTGDGVLTTANPTPEQVREVFKSLNEHIAKTNTLQEEANKWQARCSRLNNHYQSVRKQLTQLERAEGFWRYKVTRGGDVDAESEKLCDEFQITSETLQTCAQKPLAVQSPAPSPTAGTGAGKAATAVHTQVRDLTWASLSQPRVVQLLTSLNMNQYKETFTAQQVDGGLLLELDEESLERDLGIKSALHRKKMMRTITGRGQPLLELFKD